MSQRVITRWYLLLAVAILCGGTAQAAAQGNRTTISGQVTDSLEQRPLAGVEVFIVTPGATVTMQGERTDASGRYTIAGDPAGELRVRARLLGYALKERTLTVGEGETATADFALAPRTTQLDEVVITGTGGVVQRRAIGNVVETIDAKAVIQAAATRSVEQLIGSRTPGVIVLPATGQVGTGAQLRVRGVGSLSLSNDPIIYIEI